MLNLNSPLELVFIKAWEQTSKALGRPDLKAKCMFMSSSFKHSSSTMNLGTLHLIAGTSVGAGSAVLSSVTDGWKYTKMMVIRTEHKIEATLRVIQQPCYFGCLTLLVTKDFTGFL